MILQNTSNENKIFIDESLEEFITIHKDEDEPRSKRICMRGDNKIYQILFCEENLTIACVDEIFYDADKDRLWFYARDIEAYHIADRLIKDDELVSLSLGIEEGTYQYININIVKLPKFLFEDDRYEQYPKFEVNLSDCIYSMKIYLNEYEYMEIPDFQSFYNITDTLKYINDLVFFLKLGNHEFLNHLCNDTELELSIYDKDHKCIGCEVIKYKLGEQGLYLTSTSDEGELENQLVPYHTFFKLVMDKTWEVDFDL